MCFRMSMATLSHLLRTLFHSLPTIDVLMPSLDHHVDEPGIAYVVIRPRALHILFFPKREVGYYIHSANAKHPKPPRLFRACSSSSIVNPLPAPFCTLAPKKTSSVPIPFSLSLALPMKTLSEKYSAPDSRPLLSGTQFLTNATVRVLGRLNKHANSVFWFCSFITMKYIVDDGACACVFLFRHLD